MDERRKKGEEKGGTDIRTDADREKEKFCGRGEEGKSLYGGASEGGESWAGSSPWQVRRLICARSCPTMKILRLVGC